MQRKTRAEPAWGPGCSGSGAGTGGGCGTPMCGTPPVSREQCRQCCITEAFLSLWVCRFCLFFFFFFFFCNFPLWGKPAPLPPHPPAALWGSGAALGVPQGWSSAAELPDSSGALLCGPTRCCMGDVQGWTPHPRLAAQSPSAIANKYIRQSPLPGTGLGRSCREEDGCGEVGSAPPAVNPQEL